MFQGGKVGSCSGARTEDRNALLHRVGEGRPATGKDAYAWLNESRSSRRLKKEKGAVMISLRGRQTLDRQVKSVPTKCPAL